jgi:putative endonuclease
MATQSGTGAPWSLSPKQLLWKLSDSARQFRERQTLSPEAALGRRGEDLAHRYLRSTGLTIVARNYRPKPGEAEVDLVARDRDTVIFVEVKARRSDEFASPERAIDDEKRKRIVRAARAYCTRANVPWNHVRFDTVSIVFTKPPSIVHHQDAFFEGRSTKSLT